MTQKYQPIMRPQSFMMRGIGMCRLVLFAYLVVFTGCQDEDAWLAEHLARANDYFDHERYAEAAIEYKNVLQTEPSDGAVHYQLALTYFKLEKAEEGFWELRETVRLDPSNHQAVIEFSQIAIMAGEAREALRRIDGLLASQEIAEEMRLHLIRGQALETLERHEEANAAYRLAAAVAPENESALYALARSETRAERKDEAHNAWQRLVEVHSNFLNYSRMARAVPQFMEDREAAAQLRERLLLAALEVSGAEDRTRAYEQAASFYMATRRSAQAFALLEAGLETEEDPVEVSYILARLYRSIGNVERADQLFEETVAARPEDPSVHRILSAYRAQQGDFASALESVERAAALDPEDDLTRIQQAEILMELGFREQRAGAAAQAHDILAELLEREPENAFALVADARLQIGEKKPERAVSQLRAALDIRPEWAEAYYLLGVAFVSKRDYIQARVELGRALELDSSLQGAKSALANVHFKLGEWRYCVAQASAYLKAAPADNGVRLQMAQALVRMGLPDAASRELERVPEEARGAELLFAIGRVRQSQGDMAGARESLEAANEALPHQLEILQALVDVDRVEGRLEESKARVAAALEAQPENPEFYRLRGVLFFNDAQIEEAEADFNRAIELAPRDMEGHERLARFYVRIGQLEKAVQAYQAAIEIDPAAAPIHHSLGELYERRSQPERAIEHYESAIEHGSENIETKNNLAYLYADRGEQLSRALDLAQDAKRLLPDNPSISDTLGWVLYKRGLSGAAIAYLEEAAAKSDPKGGSIAMIRFHLAMALDAEGESARALESVEHSLKDLTARRFASLAAGKATTEINPSWVAEARTLRARLEAVQASAN